MLRKLCTCAVKHEEGKSEKGQLKELQMFASEGEIRKGTLKRCFFFYLLKALENSDIFIYVIRVLFTIFK